MRALVCQQGIGAGGRRCGAAWGVHGGSLLPAPCVNLRPWWEHAGDGCWALCPWLCCDRAPTAHVLLKKTLPGTYKVVHAGTCLHTCVSPKVTCTCALVRQQANASLPEPQAPLPSLPAGRSPEPMDGQLGAARGPVSSVVA